MKFKVATKHHFLKAVPGVALTVLCGLLLGTTPLGEAWVNTSYDYLFRFSERTVTNKVVLILMDNEAHDQLHQPRGQLWDRTRHAELLNKLADDDCPLVVFDSFFRNPGDPSADEALANAMRRQRHVVLMAEQADVAHPNLASARPILPADLFLGAVSTNWGVAWLDPDLDLTVRRHWPFPSPGPYPSLPWTVARLAGAHLNPLPQERWLRYYGPNGNWTSLSYNFALTKGTNYFRDKIVFIGNKPKTSVPGDEEDEFRTPYTRWTRESAGGVEILATEFLNLMNGGWLRRPAPWVEMLVLGVTGVLLGETLCRVRPLAACGLAAGAGLAVSVGAIWWSNAGNFWFPWLVIAGGQVPCALAWTLLVTKATAGVRDLTQELPEISDYKLVNPPFGEGSYGKVWLARNAIGQWQALKVVYQAKFGQNTEPYDREFRGIRRYKPVSEKHPGLLRVDFVSAQRSEGHFYYVMELGDALLPGWEKNPAEYRPRDLARVRAQANGRRLPVRECVRIGLVLAEALEFLHQQGLTHRDIKPQNIIFVNGQPKLADVGLVAEIRPVDGEKTWVGTPDYMPPPPEPPGTPQADIYGLGMVLYVICTGRDPASFPEVPTTLVEIADHASFIRLNAIVLKACEPDRTQRYTTAAEMNAALLELQKMIGDAPPQ